MSLRHADARHARIILVDWMLGNRCNFACDYCPSELHDGSVPWIDIDQVLRFLDQLADHYISGLGQQVWLQLTGGEPTQYPKFFDLCAAAHARDMRVAVISNGSRTARFWTRAVEVLDSVILTYHDLQVDHAVFLDTVRIVTQHGKPLHINVTAHPDRFEDIVARARSILEVAKSASLTLKPLRVDFGDKLYPYSDEQMEILSSRLKRPRSSDTDHALDFQRGVMTLTTRDGAARNMRANDLILKGLNHWKGQRCRAGLESLRINARGEVRRAVCGVGGKLGKIGGEIAFPVVSVTCDRDACACVSDILVTKGAA